VFFLEYQSVDKAQKLADTESYFVVSILLLIKMAIESWILGVRHRVSLILKHEKLSFSLLITIRLLGRLHAS
jgi:hypothetical protein